MTSTKPLSAQRQLHCTDQPLRRLGPPNFARTLVFTSFMQFSVKQVQCQCGCVRAAKYLWISLCSASKIPKNEGLASFETSVTTSPHGALQRRSKISKNSNSTNPTGLCNGQGRGCL